MPVRKVAILPGECHHIFNRGFQRERIFHKSREYKEFLKKVSRYLHEFPMINMHAYSLPPNHFHFLISSHIDSKYGYVSEFMGRLQNSYAISYQLWYGLKKRGSFFEGRFQNVRIDSQEQLHSCHEYIVLNALHHGYVTDIDDWRWTSFHDTSSFPIKKFDSKTLLPKRGTG